MRSQIAKENHIKKWIVRKIQSEQGGVILRTRYQ